MTKDDRSETLSEFKKAVNMPPARLERWLSSDESKSVGLANGKNKQSSDGPEAIGHESGRKIVAIKRKKKAELTDEDYAHMKKVISYVSRHSKQKPSGDAHDSRWRHSLMNWGHDPEKA